MSVKIYESEYKDQKAISVENSFIKARFLCDRGSKLCSFIDKQTGMEFMYQRKGEKYRVQPYDGDFLLGECSGFDDMFPSISECHYEFFPWKGTRIPDHGEVWTLKYDYEINKDTLSMTVYGVRFLYRIDKKVSFLSDKVLRIAYKVVNLSGFDMDFIWAAHMMVNAVEGCRVFVPGYLKKAVCTQSESGLIGEYGDEFDWPKVKAADGKTHDVSVLRNKNVKDFQKLFFKDKLKEGWCALKYPDNDTLFGITFPVETVPYLSILQGEGGFLPMPDLHCVFFEPCTAPFDRIDVARLHGKHSVLKANSEYSWYLNITIDQKNDVKWIDEYGKIY